MATLISEGLLVVRPGIGTVVAAGRAVPASTARIVPDEETERLVVEARRAGLTLQDVLAAIRRHWSRLLSRAG